MRRISFAFLAVLLCATFLLGCSSKVPKNDISWQDVNQKFSELGKLQGDTMDLLSDFTTSPAISDS